MKTRKLCYRKDDRAMHPTYGCPEHFRDSLTTPTALFPTFSWAFVPIKPMNVPTKFEVHSFTQSWDNRGYPKNLCSPWICPLSLFSKIINGLFIRIGTVNIHAKFKVRSFTRSWDNRGYPKNLGSPWIRHAPFSRQILMGFYSDRPCKYTRQIWSPVPEIKGGTQKNWAVLDTPMLPFLQNF